jgi:hypothetical protein
LFPDQDELSNLYSGPSIDASYQVSVHLVSDWSISKQSSPLKPLGQVNRNFVGNIYGMSSKRIADFFVIRYQKWPPQAILVSDRSISKNLL